MIGHRRRYVECEVSITVVAMAVVIVIAGRKFRHTATAAAFG